MAVKKQETKPQDGQRTSKPISNSSSGFSSHPWIQGACVSITYLSSIPIAAKLCQSGGLVERAVVPSAVWLATLTNISPTPLRLLLSAAALNAAWTYCATCGLSIMGQTMGTGYNNREPRTAQINLTRIARRMVSAHHNLLETFPLFAFSTAVAITVAPPQSLSDPILTSLLLHVFLKIAIFTPAYVWDMDNLRTLSHILSVGCAVSAIVAAGGQA